MTEDKSKLITAFLEYMKYEKNRSELTVVNYGSDLEAFADYVQAIDQELTWNTIDSDVIRDWMEMMMERGNTATSVNRRLSALRSFYRFALTRGYVEHDPAARVTGPKNKKPLPQFLKEAEMERLLNDVEWGEDYKNVRARTIVIMFYETGMRLAELVGLDDNDFDAINRQIKVTGKRNKQRIIPFGEELEQSVRRYMSLRDETVNKQSSALFLTNKGCRMTPAQVREEVKRCLSMVCTLKKKSPHVLRHTFATTMLNHEAGLESVRQLLGHASLSTTEIYTHTTFEQLKREYENAHPRS